MSDLQKRRRLAPAQRRELIVEAAGRLFAEHGFDGTRLQDVAAASGVTKPVLYRHFASKTALYLALLQRHRDDLPSFVDAMPVQGPLRERVRAVLDQWFAYVEAHPYAWRMLFRDSGGGPEVAAVRAEVIADARTVIAGAIDSLAASRIPPAEVEPLAELMRAGMAGLALSWIEDPVTPRDAIVDAMARAWDGLLN